MGHPLTISTVGVLALLGIGAGVHLGYAAIAEINPIYYEEAQTRFHADLSPNRRSDSAPEMMLVNAGDPAPRSDCVGCRTYPEEYYPIHDASIDRYSSSYARDADLATAAVELPEEAEPEALRLREDIRKVERFARGAADAPIVYASAEAEVPDEAQRDELPAED